MTEQTPGELIYEYTIQSTGVTSCGVPALDALLSGIADIPPQGPGTTSPSTGRSSAGGYEERLS
jgi:hypothetical protein